MSTKKDYKEGQILYRYFDNVCAPPAPKLTEWKIIELTKTGAWVREKDEDVWLLSSGTRDPWVGGRKKWMSLESYRRWAWATKDKAYESYIIRKRKHWAMVKGQYNHLKQIIEYLDDKARENKKLNFATRIILTEPIENS